VTGPAAVTEYRSGLGALNHIACHTWPDISFAVGCLLRFIQAPAADKVARILHVMFNSRGASSFGLHLGGPDCVLNGFCDADFAQCRVTRRSTPDILIQCTFGSLVWRSKRQATVSRSATEAEYIAAGEVAKEVQYSYELAGQLELAPGCVELRTDNTGVICLVKDPLS
jgi:hypothetical protein